MYFTSLWFFLSTVTFFVRLKRLTLFRIDFLPLNIFLPWRNLTTSVGVSSRCLVRLSFFYFFSILVSLFNIYCTIKRHFIFQFSYHCEFLWCFMIRQQKERKEMSSIEWKIIRIVFFFLMLLANIYISYEKESWNYAYLKKFRCTEIASYFTRYLLILSMSIGFYWQYELIIKIYCFLDFYI